MKQFRNFAHHEDGNVAIFFALGGAALAGMAGVAINMGNINYEQTQMQESLDAAVLAGTALPFNATDGERISAAEVVFAANSRNGTFVVSERASEFQAGFTVKPVFTVEHARVSGIAKSTRPAAFGTFVGAEDVSVVLKAQAEKLASDPVCVLALDQSSPNGLEVYGKAQFNARNCAVQANSDDAGGMRTYGNGKAQATQFGVTGDYKGDGFSPTPFNNIEPVTDPYAGVPVPTPGTCVDLGGKMQQSTVTLSPGTYCSGLNVKAHSKVTLLPGTYIMLDGQFSVNSGSTVTGNEVTIAFVGANSYLHMLSDSTVNITSPTSGTYKNIQMMSDRVLSQSKFEQEWTTILSGATLTYDGVLYLPEQQFWVSGTAGAATIKGSSPAMIMVADKIWAQGNAVFDLTHENKRNIDVEVGHASFAYGSRLVR